MKLLIICHVFNPLVWPSLNVAIRSVSDWGNECDVVVTVPDEDVGRLVTQDSSICRIVIAPNQGMDIGGFFLGCAAVRDKLQDYEWVLKLHSKTNRRWRDQLIQPITST